MSLNFSFNCEQKGWKLTSKLENGYLNHTSSTGRWNNDKFINIWETSEGHLVAELMLTQGYSCLIDYDQMDKVCQYTWSAAKDGMWGVRGVAHCKVSKKCILLHKLLYDKSTPEGFTIDHINCDFPDAYALDNRRSNIRFTDKNTHNVRKYKNNTSGEPNIVINKYGKFNIQVTVDQKRLYCPYYEPSEFEEAKVCRDIFKVILHNFSDRQFSTEQLNFYSKVVCDAIDGTLSQEKLKVNILKLLENLEKYDVNKFSVRIAEIRQRVRDQLEQYI